MNMTWIELTRTEDGKSIYINKSSIIGMFRTTVGTRLVCQANNITVKESPEDILSGDKIEKG
jgi:hypothetical protein